MKSAWTQLLLVLIVAGFVFFFNLGEGQLWDRDEPRNAGCAAEMLARGDWVTPIFNSEMRHQKPALTYWLIMSAYTLFGQSEFAARFWSALLATGTVGLTWGIGRHLFGTRVATLSAICLCSTLMFVVAARAATPDSVLIFFSVAGIATWVWTTFKPASLSQTHFGIEPRVDGRWFPRSWLAAAAIYGLFAAGVLAKGPVAIVMPSAIIGMFMLIQRLPGLPENQFKSKGFLYELFYRAARPFHPWHFLKTCGAMQLLIAVAMVALIAAPWYVWVGIRTEGDWVRMFFLNEHWGRATTAFESHRGGIWYYPLALMLGFFPWSVFFAPVFVFMDRQFKKHPRHTQALTFLICWVAVQIGIFSIAKTKLPSYITPCYPAVALLIGVFFDRLLAKETQSKAWLNASAVSLGLAGVFIVGGLAWVGQDMLQDCWWLGLVGLIPIVGATGLFWLISIQRFRLATAVQGVSAVLFVAMFFGVAAVQVNKTQLTNIIFDEINQAENGQAIASYGCLESTWVYYVDRPIYEISMEPVLPESRALDREKDWKPKPRVGVNEFLAQRPNAMFITTDEHLEVLKSELPVGYEVRVHAPYFLKARQLYLLAPSDRGSRIADAAERLLK